MSPVQRRQQRAGLIWLAGAGCVLLGLLWAIAHGRQLSVVGTVLLALGAVAVVAGSVLGLSTLTFLADRRRRRARRRARARSFGGPGGSGVQD